MTRWFAIEVNAPGLVKRLYGGKNAGRAREIVRHMKVDCGWDARWPEPGSVGVVPAASWDKAVEKVWREQMSRGILTPSP